MVAVPVMATSFLTLHPSTLLNRPHITLFHKPNSFLTSSPKPNLLLSSNNQNKSKFKISSTTAPTTGPFSSASPEVETEADDQEKFDWFSHWYPVAAVCDLDKRVPHGRRVMGLDIVAWWDRNEDKWQVFNDTCPHRLAPLSEGRIDQWGRLQCVYHGWCFNGSGDCNFIPQAPPDGPPVHTSRKACAAVYPCIVQNKILWFWPSSDPQYKDIATKKQPPYVPELDDPSYSSLLMSRDVSYGYEILTENLMDPAHVPYAHYGILVPPEEPRRKADREGGTPIDINVPKIDKNGFLAKQDNAYNKFVAPCLYCYFVNPASDYGPSSSGSVQNKTSQKRVLLVFFCIPVSPGKSRVLFSFPRNFALWVDRVIPRWILHIRSNLVLDSDLYLLHQQERKLINLGPSNWQKAFFVPTKSDGSIIAFRNWLRKYSDGQIPWGEKFSSELFPTPPKEQLMDRYWSHVVNCSSCSKAVNLLKAFEAVLPVISLASVGIVAIRQSMMSVATKISLVSFAVLCFAVSRWLSHFIYKIFYFHDYNHAETSLLQKLFIQLLPKNS